MLAPPLTGAGAPLGGRAPQVENPCLRPPSFSFQSIKETDVLGELLNLDIHNSAGLDELDLLFLKKAAYIIAAPIT